MGRIRLDDLTIDYDDAIVNETWLNGTAMRNIERIKAEIGLLEREYDPDRILWSADYSWIRVHNWKLPPNYNATRCNILVLVPDKYGYGPSYQDFFVPTGLKIRSNGGWVTSPHFFHTFPYKDRIDTKLLDELKRNEWSYVCLHPVRWTSADNIVTYLTQVYTFLSDPFRPWDR